MPTKTPQNKSKRYSDKQEQYISDLYHIHGKSVNEIAKMFKRTEAGIRYVLQKDNSNLF